MKKLLHNKRKIFINSGILLFIFLLSFIFAMQSELNIWSINGETGTDSSVFKTIAWLMTKGYMPYLDTFDHKGPLTYIYNWIGIQISYWRGIWVVELLNLFVTFVLIYKIARLRCGRFYSCVVLLIISSALFEYFESGNLVEEYAMPYITLSLLIFIDYFINNKINTFRLVICGFSFGAVCMFRPNMISVWIVFCIAVLVKTIIDKEYKELGYFIAFFSIGIFIVVVPICIWLISKGAFGDFIKDYLIFNHAYSSSTVDRARFFNKYSSFSYFLNNTIVLFSIVVLVYFVKVKKFLHTFYIIYLFTTLLLICLSGQTSLHYSMVLIPAFTYPFAIFAECCEKNMQENKLISLVAIGYLLVGVALPKWINAIDHSMLCYDTKDKDKRTQAITEVLDIIESETSYDDKITVWGNWNIVYALSHRVSASRYSYQFPIGEVEGKIFDEYYEEIEYEKPVLIIVQRGRALDGLIKIINKYSYSLIYGEEEEQGVRIYKR